MQTHSGTTEFECMSYW